MKTVLVIRHAKSSWESGVISDFDRPLNERGKRDAPIMARRLLSRPMAIDLFVSSPAKRARHTARVFVEEYGLKKEDLLLEPELYHPSIPVFYGLIARLEKQYSSVAIFSHNPGITDFVNSLATAQVDNIPTCGIFAIRADVNDWKDFATARKEFLFFDFPKAGE